MLGPEGPETPAAPDVVLEPPPAEIAPVADPLPFACGSCSFKGKSPGSLGVHIGRAHGPKKPKARKAPKPAKPAKKESGPHAPEFDSKLASEWKPSELAFVLRELARNLEAKAEDYRSVADHLEETGRDGQAVRS